jgi:hypothetical protein
VDGAQQASAIRRREARRNRGPSTAAIHRRRL